MEDWKNGKVSRRERKACAKPAKGVDECDKSANPTCAKASAGAANQQISKSTSLR
jgi:hypothetical protein